MSSFEFLLNRGYQNSSERQSPSQLDNPKTHEQNYKMLEQRIVAHGNELPDEFSKFILRRNKDVPGE